ncbi:MAG: quinone-interacting membrane-bound oxidoreductase complex subunit QmoC [Desulfobacterales bacterium]|nr:quinone-interacting membrane-bound oxidoreductase complex subunit QmoC [Desulfobacterales bacterium]
MTERYLVQPDLEFIKEIQSLGGETVKKCFQCATCSVVCPLSPESGPFPRKEMIAASWGLKDKLINDSDIWLCHECGDCSDKCPRGAKPGDVLSALRAMTIGHYATPQVLYKAVNDPKKLPVLIGVPAIIFAILAIFTNLFHETLSHGLPENVIAHANFISTWFVDLVFVPLSLFVVAVFAKGLTDFVKNIHENAINEGKVEIKSLELKPFLQTLIKVIPMILSHEKFTKCEANKDRSTAHMMVLFSFIGLAVVTGIFFVVLYVFGIPGPYSQINPVKILANISGVALVIGGALMIKNRLTKPDQTSAYKDWYLVGLVFGLGITGMLTQMTRLAGGEYLSYFLYYVHLIFVFNLFLFLPYSKMAHLVYRTVAITYNEYMGRK